MSVSQLQMGRRGGERKTEKAGHEESWTTLPPFPCFLIISQRRKSSGVRRLPRRFLRWIHEKLRSSGIGFQKLREAATVSGWIICQVGRMASLVG